MRSFFATAVLTAVSVVCFAQNRPASPLVYEKSYSHTKISKSLRDLVNQNEKQVYFRDEFFNSMLRKTLEDPQYTSDEKVRIFYLMLQKLGYGFAGVEYVPPRQSYFAHHLGKIYVLEKTSRSLSGVKFGVSDVLRVMKKELDQDPLMAGNALLLATMLGRDSAATAINTLLDTAVISSSKMPGILNHYACLSASLSQNDTTVKRLERLLTGLKKEEMIEDALCALYSKNNPVTPIQKYVISENNPANDLAIQTALNALSFRVPDASYRHSIKTLLATTRMRWKEELLRKLLNNDIPFNYSLTNADTLVTKSWDGVVVSTYLNGTLISIGEFMEFDPN